MVTKFSMISNAPVPAPRLRRRLGPRPLNPAVAVLPFPPPAARPPRPWLGILSDIENAIMAHDAVVQAAVVPMPDDVMGEKACLFVTLKDGGSFSFDEMTAHLGDAGFAKMKWPERLEIIDEMPVTPTRKIIKGELVARLQ